MSSDAIVVGGGPCGSFAAFNLAKLGAKVSVFEEHHEIGAPSHCTGLVSISGLKHLGLDPLPSRIVENVIRGGNYSLVKRQAILGSFFFTGNVCCQSCSF